ncbi:hypothetical protein L0Y47_13755 [Ectopseudomonas composti]
MSIHRSLAWVVATALCATTNLSSAEQISGQLQISLTILKRCEVAARSDAAGVYLSAHGCEHAAYRLQDVNGRALPLAFAGTTSVTVQSVEDVGSTLVIYW